MKLHDAQGASVFPYGPQVIFQNFDIHHSGLLAQALIKGFFIVFLNALRMLLLPRYTVDGSPNRIFSMRIKLFWKAFLVQSSLICPGRNMGP